jgi:hypothetical protein
VADTDALVDGSELKDVAIVEELAVCGELEMMVAVERLDIDVAPPEIPVEPRRLVTLIDTPLVVVGVPGGMLERVSLGEVPDTVNPVDDIVVGIVVPLIRPTIKDVEAARAVDRVPVTKSRRIAASTFPVEKASSNCAL